MAKHVRRQNFKDRETYRAALRRQYVKSSAESRTDYEKKVERVRVPTRYGKVVRNTSIAMLAVFLFFLGTYFVTELYHDHRSRENVAALQEFVATPPVGRRQLAAAADLEAETVGNTAEEGADTAEANDAFAPDAPPLTEIPAARLAQYFQLYTENNDFCGWLTIPDTIIDYPVMHRADDNDFYLSHNFNQEEDVNGLLVLDKRCDADGAENHLLIHGHNMKSGFMFGGLKRYKDKGYCESHPEIQYDSLYGSRTYQIFAVFLSSTNLADTEDFHYYDYIEIASEEAFDAYVSAAKRQSLYDIDVDAEYGDYLLTLSTCDYTKDNGRLVIVARCRGE